MLVFNDLIYWYAARALHHFITLRSGLHFCGLVTFSFTKLLFLLMMQLAAIVSEHDVIFFTTRFGCDNSRFLCFYSHSGCKLNVFKGLFCVLSWLFGLISSHIVVSLLHLVLFSLSFCTAAPEYSKDSGASCFNCVFNCV